MANAHIQRFKAFLGTCLNHLPSKTTIAGFVREQELDLLALIPCLVSAPLHNRIAAMSGVTADGSGYSTCEKCTRLHSDPGRPSKTGCSSTNRRRPRCTWCAQHSRYRTAVYCTAVCVASVCMVLIIDWSLAVVGGRSATVQSLGSSAPNNNHASVQLHSGTTTTDTASSSSEPEFILVSKIISATHGDGQAFLQWSTDLIRNNLEPHSTTTHHNHDVKPHHT